MLEKLFGSQAGYLFHGPLLPVPPYPGGIAEATPFLQDCYNAFEASASRLLETFPVEPPLGLSIFREMPSSEETVFTLFDGGGLFPEAIEDEWPTFLWFGAADDHPLKRRPLLQMASVCPSDRHISLGLERNPQVPMRSLSEPLRILLQGLGLLFQTCEFRSGSVVCDQDLALPLLSLNYILEEEIQPKVRNLLGLPPEEPLDPLTPTLVTFYGTSSHAILLRKEWRKAGTEQRIHHLRIKSLLAELRKISSLPFDKRAALHFTRILVKLNQSLPPDARVALNLKITANLEKLGATFKVYVEELLERSHHLAAPRGISPLALTEIAGSLNDFSALCRYPLYEWESPELRL